MNVLFPIGSEDGFIVKSGSGKYGSVIIDSDFVVISSEKVQEVSVFKNPTKAQKLLLRIVSSLGKGKQNRNLTNRIKKI